LHRGASEGPVDRLEGDSSRESKEPRNTKNDPVGELRPEGRGGLRQNTESDDEKVKRMSCYKGMLRPWNPTKVEIESWLKTKELDFAQKDNKNPRVTSHKYLEKYMFTDLHEVFFYDFPHLLHEWILRLKDNHATNWIRQLEWTSVQIEQLQ
jgi:hypothetical protein